MSNWLKILLSVLLVLVVACAVFLLVVLVVSTINNVNFVEQLKTWFGVAPKETVASINQAFLNFIK